MKSTKILPGLLYILIVFFYIDVWHNANTTSRLLPVKTLVESNTWQIDTYHEQTIDKALINGHYYSDKAPLPVLITVPFYWLAFHSGISNYFIDGGLYIIGSVIIGILPFLLISCLMYRRHQQNNFNSQLSMAYTMLLMLSTFIFIYAGTAFSHLLAAYFLLLAYISLKEKKRYLLTGFFSGAAMLCEFPLGITLILWPVFILLQTRKITNSIHFILGSLPFLIALFIYNFYFTGSPFDMLYNHEALDNYNASGTIIGFSIPSFTNMFLLLLSPFRGLFLYAIPCLLVLIIWGKSMKFNFKNILTYIYNSAAAWYCIATVLLLSSHLVWYGGWSFGPRHLIPLCLLLLYKMPFYLKYFPEYVKWFLSVTFIGLLLTFSAKVTLLYSINADFKNPIFELILPAIQNASFNENNLLTLIFGLNSTLAALVFLTISTVLLIWLLFTRQAVRNNI